MRPQPQESGQQKLAPALGLPAIPEERSAPDTDSRGIAMRSERRPDMMKLGAFYHPTGSHIAAWLHPEAQADAGTNFRRYAALAQTAERGDRATGATSPRRSSMCGPSWRAFFEARAIETHKLPALRRPFIATSKGVWQI
jgi:hypothetical protein